MSSTGRLTEEQERRRIEGLRTLARIIARHYLKHPEPYHQLVDAAEGHAAADGKATREEGAE